MTSPADRTSSAARGREEAAKIYAALRRAGAGNPAFRQAMENAAAKLRETRRGS